MKNRTVAITTLGCKVNQFESASFASGFEANGFEMVPFSQTADIYVINSCAVTGKAGSQSRQMVRRALRTNPKARIIVTGCYSQIAAQEIIEIADTPICIVGNGNKHLLVDIAMSDKFCDLELYMGDIGRKKEICSLPVKKFSGRTRAYVKIQDGCNNFCSYCIVPYARGRVRSLRPEKVMEQLDIFAEEGYRELVLTGIHVGVYGNDFAPRESLTGLVDQICKRDDNIRYRISSLEPGEITDEMLQLMAGSSKFMPHLHLPLQSGDDNTLQRMNRRYTVAEFKETIGRIIAVMPEAAIGLDVLVGFPGEDEKAFMSTLELIEQLPIAYLHVFPYSKRPGTAAEAMPDHLPKTIKDARASLLRELDHKKRTAFYSKYVGTTRQVLAESKKNKFKLMKGFSDNYIPIHFEAPATVTNKIVNVKIERVMDQTVFGTMLD
jgi:threonylcarbamoyladenosine tRNA methylthiotransferase MtaB